ncbi:unnamed protein product, partial [Didymodactylos carnosus]
MLLNRSTTSLNLFVFMFMFLLYMFIGALIFSTIERPSEKVIIQEMTTKRNEFLKNFPCVKENEFDIFMDALIDANKHGVDARQNTSNWSFSQSFFFAVTVVTTIGYGHVSPLSEIGRIFCIVYAIIGVPMTLILLTIIVRKILILLNKSYLWFRRNYSTNRTSESCLRYIHLSIILFISLLFLFIIPSLIFSYIEQDWNIIDAFYYCFISLTTIGLGDYVPGDKPVQNNRLMYKICITIYLLVGVTIMMLLVSMVSQMPEFRVVQYFLSETEVENDRSSNEHSGLLWFAHSPQYGIHSLPSASSSISSNIVYRRQLNDKESNNVLSGDQTLNTTTVSIGH